MLIDFTFSGIFISFIFSHPAKAYAAIYSRDEGRVTSESDLHFLKAESPIYSTDSGITSSANVLPSKEESDMYLSDSGSMTDFIFLFSKHPPATEEMLSGIVIFSGRSSTVSAVMISIRVFPAVKKVILSSAFCSFNSFV